MSDQPKDDEAPDERAARLSKEMSAAHAIILCLLADLGPKAGAFVLGAVFGEVMVAAPDAPGSAEAFSDGFVRAVPDEDKERINAAMDAAHVRAPDAKEGKA